jgi:hypothetical protein
MPLFFCFHRLVDHQAIQPPALPLVRRQFQGAAPFEQSKLGVAIDLSPAFLG